EFIYRSHIVLIISGRPGQPEKVFRDVCCLYFSVLIPAYTCNNRTYVLSYIKRTRVRITEGDMQDAIQKEMTLNEKLNILSDAAKYDVSCSSSGVERKGDGTGTGNCSKAGICHSFSA